MLKASIHIIGGQARFVCQEMLDTCVVNNLTTRVTDVRLAGVKDILLALSFLVSSPIPQAQKERGLE
jgi:uncharacterized membrane protein